MFGLFAAFGPIAAQYDAERIQGLWFSGSKSRDLSDHSLFSMARFVPEHHRENPIVHASRDSKFHMILDGYVITESTQAISGSEAQVTSLMGSFQAKGIREGLRCLVAGSYVLVTVDMEKQIAHIVTDPAGSQPAYIASVKNGWLVSTSSTALGRTGDVDTTMDMTACAEWVLFSYAVGERYPVKGINVIPPGMIIKLDLHSGTATREKYERFWETPLGETSPPVERTADAFRKACSRLQVIDPRPAHLQSSGMDSRLITASWPAGYNPSCFTYGDPDAHEVQIARTVAETRGSPWTHTWQHGDEVADIMPPIFQESGIIMWPDRRFVAEKIASKGESGVLDGLVGDVMLGGTYYGHTQYYGRYRKINRAIGIPLDIKQSEISMDKVTESMFDYILQVSNINEMKLFLNNDYVISIQKEKINILQDIYKCLLSCKPDSDSIAMLWRNFLLATRAAHYTNQQGVVCKRFINVYYPFSNDNDFSRTAMSIQPMDAMYRRYYIRLYRRCHPRYARIPYGDTLIPLRRPVLNHVLSKKLLSKNLSIPWLTGSPRGRVRDPNGWSIWLQESAKLRDYVRSSLAVAGMLDKHRSDGYFRDIASGKEKGGGKLFHLASIANWMTLRKSTE